MGRKKKSSKQIKTANSASKASAKPIAKAVDTAENVSKVTSNKAPKQKPHDDTKTVVAPITPANVRQILERFSQLLTSLPDSISPQQALQDRVAQVQADSSDRDMSDLYPERVYLHHIFLQSIQSLFPQQSFPVVDEQQTRAQIKDKMLEYFYNLGDWSALWEALKQQVTQFPDGQKIVEFAESMQHFFNPKWLNLLTDEEKKRHDELDDLIFEQGNHQAELIDEFNTIEDKVRDEKLKCADESEASLKRFKKFMLGIKSKECGREFADLEEAMQYESAIRLKEQLPRLAKLSPREIREELARTSATDTFYHLVATEISSLQNDKKTDNKQDESDAKDADTMEVSVLPIFQSMIEDFISTDSNSLWPFGSDSNFAYDTLYSQKAGSLLDESCKTQICATATIDCFENVLDDLHAILRDIDNECELTDQQKYLRMHLIWDIEHQLIEEFLSSKHENIYLVEAIRNRFKSMMTPLRIGEYRSRERYKDLLRTIHMFPYLIKYGIYSGDIEKEMYESATCSESHFKLLLPSVDSSILLHVQKALVPLKQLVNELIDQRNQHGEVSAILGIGFSGPAFDQVNFSDENENIIYLAFSYTGRTKWHQYVLTELRSRMMNSHQFEIDKIKVSIISNEGIVVPKNRNKMVHQIDSKLDKSVYQYLLEQFLNLVLFSPQNVIYPHVKEAYLTVIKMMITESSLEKSKKTQIKQSIDEQSLQKDDYELIRKLVLATHHYGCAEAALSKYGYTNKIIPVAFKANHRDQVKLNGALIFAGTQVDKQRPIIPPCHRCRLLSAPYMLLAVLNHGWGLGDLNLASQKFGQAPILPRFPLSKSSHSTTGKSQVPLTVNQSSDAKEESIQRIEPSLTEELRQPIKHDGYREQILAGIATSKLNIGMSISQGDCFFDAFAQALEDKKIDVPGHKNFPAYKRLRMLCNGYMKDTNKQRASGDWVKTSIDQDAQIGGQDHQTCLAQIQYTQAEMETLKKKDNFFDGCSTWGRPAIEGRMICEVLSTNLHIIEFQEVTIDDQKKLITSHSLVDGKGKREVSDDSIDYSDTDTVHIINYKQHYVPLLSRQLSLRESNNVAELEHDTKFAVRQEAVALTSPEHTHVKSASYSNANFKQTFWNTPCSRTWLSQPLRNILYLQLDEFTKILDPNGKNRVRPPIKYSDKVSKTGWQLYSVKEKNEYWAVLNISTQEVCNQVINSINNSGAKLRAALMKCDSAYAIVIVFSPQIYFSAELDKVQEYILQPHIRPDNKKANLALS